MSCRHQLRLLIRAASELASSLAESIGDDYITDRANINAFAASLATLVTSLSGGDEGRSAEMSNVKQEGNPMTSILSQRIVEASLAPHLISFFSSSTAAMTLEARLLLKLAKALDERDTATLASMRLCSARRSKFTALLEENVAKPECNAKPERELSSQREERIYSRAISQRTWASMSVSTDSMDSSQPNTSSRLDASVEDVGHSGMSDKVEPDDKRSDSTLSDLTPERGSIKGHKRSVSEPKWYCQDQAGEVQSTTWREPLKRDWTTNSTVLIQEDMMGASSGEESNWQLVSPPTSGWTMPVPSSLDQSLASYIGSLEFSRHQAQLDRENAHFILAEAVMQAVNKANFDNVKPKNNCLVEDLAHLSKESPATTPLSSLKSMEENVNVAEPLKGDNGDDKLRSSKNSSFNRSAQSIALQLLPSSNNSRTVTRVSDLDWFVTRDSEQEANEERQSEEMSFRKRTTKPHPSRSDNEHLLPSSLKSLSTTSPLSSSSSSPISSSSLATTSFDHDLRPTAIRGTQQWAPPRPQLILIEHKKIKVRDGLESQGYRCAGCGMSVSPKYSRTFRMCHYFGKFFCTNCHLGQVSILPAKVVRQWDFREFPVSNFAKSVINSLSTEQLFDLESINPKLIERVVRVRSAVFWRHKAILIFPYIFTCTLKDPTIERLQSEASNYRLSESSVFSLNELCSIKLGSYLRQLMPLVKEARMHVLQCQTCHLHGHLCENCHRSDILFPFEGLRVTQCRKCKGCFHIECSPSASGEECPKCQRIKKRQKLRTVINACD